MAIGALTSALTPAAQIPGIQPIKTDTAASDTAGFGESIGRLLSAADNANRDANSAVAGMLDGSADVHDAMIALQHADLTLQLTVQVRNKLVQAYQEIMRMPI